MLMLLIPSDASVADDTCIGGDEMKQKSRGRREERGERKGELN